MNTTNLNATSKQKFHSVLDEPDEMSAVVAYIHTIKGANEVYPCCFTNEEKLTRIEQSVLDARLGLGITHEEMFDRHPEWL
ncbi:hypothetical protein AGMMS49982_22010 [Bacteroidia bacterium]|nr:hypothetical protein AGMMS49982_22010 [Bacteroidia bacterium]